MEQPGTAVRKNTDISEHEIKALDETACGLLP
jgi:hypothetical protein